MRDAITVRYAGLMLSCRRLACFIVIGNACQCARGKLTRVAGFRRSSLIIRDLVDTGGCERANAAANGAKLLRHYAFFVRNFTLKTSQPHAVTLRLTPRNRASVSSSKTSLTTSSRQTRSLPVLRLRCTSLSAVSVLTAPTARPRVSLTRIPALFCRTPSPLHTHMARRPSLATRR